MKIAVGADHAGFPLKATVIEEIEGCGHEVLDLGTNSTEATDYPDHAEAVGRSLQKGESDRAILICGSGVGAAVAANKLKGIRAGVCHDTYSARQAVQHDRVNVMSLGARVIGVEVARELVRAYLNAQYSGEARHERRLAKVAALEEAG